MPTTLVLFPSRIAITDDTGARYPGAKLHVADAMTEVMALYADAARTIPLPNPVVADADGLLPMVYLTSSPFDLMASTAAGKILWQYFGCMGFFADAITYGEGA